MGFADTRYDEAPHARDIAKYVGADHHEMYFSDADLTGIVPLLASIYDEPFADSSAIPTSLIARFAREHVAVVLSGDGGDELFGGYSRYMDPGTGRIRRVFQHAPAAAKTLAPIVDRYNYPWAEELRLASSPSMAWRSYLHRLQIFDARALQNLGFPAAGHAEETIETLWNKYPGTDNVSRRQFIDQHTYLPDQILALTDRMSMANSLEVRVPFMDYRLVRFTQRVPGSLKQNSHGEFKILLKKTLGQRCPPKILRRPKWGFDTPLSRWVQQPALFDLIRGLPEGTAVKQGLFDAEGVRAFVQNPLTAGRQARRVWNMFVLEIWLQVHRRPSPPRETLSELVGAYA